MKSFCDPAHAQHAPRAELSDGGLVAPYDSPHRVSAILDDLRRRGFPEPSAPRAHGLDPILRVHTEPYVAFLRRIWDEWAATGQDSDLVPYIWPSRAMPRDVVPRSIAGRVGYYALAGDTPIGPGSYVGARSAVDVALAAQAELARGTRAAFALCRPPGHHASRDMYGGYCFFNNAAIAAQAAVDQGAARVAVLDVDVHHGNGTQAIFEARSDVLTLSIHGDPSDFFPHFLGHADERGSGAGEGYNHNYPLPRGTDYARWSEALEAAAEEITRFGPELLVVSLGVDTYEEDPIGFFRLKSEDFSCLGRRLEKLGLPTLFVMEGGYAVDALGTNVVNVLAGFEEG